jgi:redox-sensitive bicupin YhaK (pirin superfamily)
MTNTSPEAIPDRDVARIDKPEIKRGYTDAHRARMLVEPTNWSDTDPFLVLAEDWFPEGVFDKHPHRGIETVTYVIDGKIEHYDNHGNKGIIGSGDVQWMTAGRGIIHNEQPMDGQTVHSLQLWVVLPQADRMVPAHHQLIMDDGVPIRKEPGAELRVYSGASGGVTSPTTNYATVTMVELRLDANVQVEPDLPAGEAMIGTSAARVEVGQTGLVDAQ